MLWFLTLHIGALLFWCAALLYLPPLMIASRTQKSYLLPPQNQETTAHFIFTNIATPAALAAIISGTLVFMINHTATFWLIAKLTLVSGLVIVHVLVGFLLLRLKNNPEDTLVSWGCWILEIAATILIAAILWTVLYKPDLGFISGFIL